MPLMQAVAPADRAEKAGTAETEEMEVTAVTPEMAGVVAMQQRSQGWVAPEVQEE
jgi:hypothetical protein